MLKWLSRILIGIAASVLLASAVLYVSLARAASAEQAVTPGEESFGVAALGMMYWPPIIVTAAIGICTLLLGMLAMTIHRFRNSE
jgi:hypothetical protein